MKHFYLQLFFEYEYIAIFLCFFTSSLNSKCKSFCEQRHYVEKADFFLSVVPWHSNYRNVVSPRRQSLISRVLGVNSSDLHGGFNGNGSRRCFEIHVVSVFVSLSPAERDPVFVPRPWQAVEGYCVFRSRLWITNPVEWTTTGRSVTGSESRRAERIRETAVRLILNVRAQ